MIALLPLCIALHQIQPAHILIESEQHNIEIKQEHHQWVLHDKDEQVFIKNHEFKTVIRIWCNGQVMEVGE